MKPIIDSIPLMQLASGDQLALQIYRFIGQEKGKKTYIQANLHGAEIVGNSVIYQLINELILLDNQALIGEVVLVPVCNPLSTIARGHHFSIGRYNPYTGEDWNRIFWDYEKESQNLEEFAKIQIKNNASLGIIRQNYLAMIQSALARHQPKITSSSGVSFNHLYRYYLQSLCLDANYVIDIHSSTNQSIDYLYGFHGREENARYLGLDYGILLTEGSYDGDAFDEAFIKPWLALEKTFKNLGHPLQFDIESWTLELGSGMTMNPNSVEKGIQGIKNYLVRQGLLKQTISPPTTMQWINKKQIKKYYAIQGGMIQNMIPLQTEVKPHDLLYEILSFNKQKQLPQIIPIYAEEEGFIIDLATNHSVNQGEYILSLVTY